MKKLILIGLLFISIIGMSSCDYDDSNDIDILKPNDTTQINSVAYQKGF